MVTDTVAHRSLPAVPAVAVARVQSLARAVAFWLAVALPIAYVPTVLLAPAAAVDPAVLAWAVTANLFAIVLGHGYEPSRDRRSVAE